MDQAEGKTYDVFLSHHSPEKEVVEGLARRLQDDGVHPFLDDWDLQPGDPWNRKITKALGASRTCAVFVGADGIGSQQRSEVNLALARLEMEHQFRVIPVLLPGADPNSIPELRELTRVDFRGGVENEDPYRRLLEAISRDKRITEKASAQLLKEGGVKLFHKRLDPEEQRVADLLEEHLVQPVFIDLDTAVSPTMLELIAKEVFRAQKVVVLLNEALINSEMLPYGLQEVHRLRLSGKKGPDLLVIRLNYDGPLPEGLTDQHAPEILWRGLEDTAGLLSEVIHHLEARLVPRDFFVTGGPVARDALCYVERRADEVLYESLKKGEFCYLLTSRQMGKSSMRIQVGDRLQQNGIAVAMLDLTRHGSSLSIEQWYFGLLTRIGDQLGEREALEAYWSSHDQIGVLHRWHDALQHLVIERIAEPIVIFVDEIDFVRKLDFSDEFFAGIRHLYNERAENPELRRLTFCLLGVATPSDLIQDSRSTPFNIGHRIHLGDFTAEEATPLGKGLGGNRDAPKLLRRILHWTGGHPHLTQRFCQAIANHPEVQDEKGVDDLCSLTFFSNEAREVDPNLHFARDQMLKGGEDLAAVLDLYRRILRGEKLLLAETDTRMDVLRLTGVVVPSEAGPRLRNRIYEKVFDQAWVENHMPEGEKRRQRLAFRDGVVKASLIIAPIIMLLAIGVYVYFDHNVWEHTTYYNTHVRRWGIPEGVGELSSAQVGARSSSYKLITKGRSGPVIRAQVVNSSGELNPRHRISSYLQEADESPDSGRECEWEFVRDSAGRVVQEKAYDKFGQMVWGLAYSPQETKTRSRRAHFLGPDGFPRPQKKTAAAIVQFDYSEEGFEVRRRYFDRVGTPQPGPVRAYGQARVNDPRGLMIEDTSLDEEGRPMVDDVGNATGRITYDDLGNILEFGAYGSDGRPVLVKDGFHRSTFTYDEHGNLIEWAAFDVAVQPTLTKQGFHLSVRSYDERGHLINAAFFDRDRRPILNKDGFHRIESEFDAKGNRIQAKVFDTSGRPTLDRNGAHKYTYGYDDRGNLVEQAYFDSTGAPTLVKAGFHRIQLNHDDRGNILESSVFDIHGKPTLSKQGVHQEELLYDERGNLVEVAYFGPSQEPTIPTSVLYHRWTRRFDERGNPVEGRVFGTDGKPTLTANGLHRWQRVFDERGNVTEFVAYDVSDQPVSTTAGFHRVVQTYDDRGNQLSAAALDINDEPVTTLGGYALVEYAYDSRNNRTETRFYNTNREPTLSNQSFHIKRWVFDGRDRPIETAVFNTSGEAMNTAEDFHRWRKIYDDRDRPIEWAAYDTQGRPTRTRLQYHSWKQEYDDRGNSIEWAAFDESGAPTTTVNRYHRHTQAFDERDNAVVWAAFDTQGDPILNLEGHHRLETVYDEKDRKLEAKVFDAFGKPSVNHDGVHRTAFSYNARGKLETTTYFDQLGLPSGTGARRQDEYDELGRLVKAVFVDASGKPVHWNRQLAAVIGYVGYTIRYSADQRFKTLEYFGFEDHWGYEKLTIEYESGKEAHRAYLDKDGKEVEVAVVVTFIYPKSWAERNDIRVGDILVSYDGKPFDESRSAREREAEDPEGPPKILVTRRGDQTFTYELPPGKIGIFIQGRESTSPFNQRTIKVISESG